MKAITLAALAAVLLCGAAHADPLFNEEENSYPSAAFAQDPHSPPGYGVEARPGRGYEFGYRPDRDVPYVHRPALEYGPFGKGSYAQPSYRTPDTTTLGTDYRGVTTYTVSPPPRAYPPQNCEYRPEYRRVHGRLVRVEPERRKVIRRTYDYRVVNGFAQIVPPPCERIVGILAPAY